MKQRNALPPTINKMNFLWKKEFCGNLKSFTLKMLYFHKKTTLPPLSYENIKWIHFGHVLSLVGEQTGAKLLFLLGLKVVCFFSWIYAWTNSDWRTRCLKRWCRSSMSSWLIALQVWKAINPYANWNSCKSVKKKSFYSALTRWSFQSLNTHLSRFFFF